MPKALSADKLAEIKVRAARLSELKSHPSWAELRALLEERKARRFGLLQRQLIDGIAVDQRYLDRLAGFFKGAEWILDNPDMAEQSLERAVERALREGLLGKELVASD
jgi:hypothetical protein